LCLYFMGLNLSNEQIARELSLNESDVYQMTVSDHRGSGGLNADQSRRDQAAGPGIG
jgi:hypothetical protein